MKKLVVISSFILVFAFILLLNTLSFAQSQVGTSYQPTLSSTHLSNYAVVTGANFLSQSKQVFTTNRPIIGGSWSCTNFYDHLSVVAGTIFSNKTFLTNQGNTNWLLQVGVQSNFVNGGKPFAWQFSTNAVQLGWHNGALKAVFTKNLPAGDVFPITFYVSVSNVNSATQNYCLFASNISAQVSVNKSNYKGDNLQKYGGDFGWGWGGFQAANGPKHIDGLYCIEGNLGAHSVNQSVEVLETGAPNITFSKTIFSITLNGVASLPIPGATIKFDIYITNQGAQANGIIIKDYLQTNGMKFVGGSMTNTTGTGGPFTWQTNQPNVLASGVLSLNWTNKTAGGLGSNAADHIRFKVFIK